MNKEMLDELKAKGLTNLAELLEGKVKTDDEDEPDLDDEGKPKSKLDDTDKKEIKESAIETFAKTLELSEEQIAQIKEIFEGAVEARVLEKVTVLDEAVKEQMTALEEKQDQTITNYLDFVVEGWVKQHEAPLVSAAKVELAESMMKSLQDLFVTHELVLAEDKKLDHIAEAKKETASVQVELEEAVAALSEAKAELFGNKLVAVIAGLTEGMVDTDKERFADLVNEVDVEIKEGIEAATAKLQALKESFVPTPAKVEETQVVESELEMTTTVEEVEIKEETTKSTEKPLDAKMASYVKAVKSSF